MTNTYDLIIIGAGSGGLTAARFAAQLEAKVALVEKERIGGDCTWTGCVPSKALLKVAKVAHQARTAAQYGIGSQNGTPAVNMGQVRDYIRQAIAEVYQHETPEQLTKAGVEVVSGAAHFLDPHTVQAGERTLSAKKIIIATGASAFVPPIPGIKEVPWLTNQNLFDNDRLPNRFIVIGAGPIGAEIAQAYQRLGSQVTLIDIGLLPREEPEVAQVMGQLFAREGLRFVKGLVSTARREGDEIVLTVAEQTYRGDMLLLAVGRAPNVVGLALEKAGISHSPKGIPVDTYLRTNIKHIYAVGDCVAGNYQFTHVAAWQAFQATRNALLPLNSSGFSEVVPWTTFTDPEVAHVGLTEADARKQFSEAVQVSLWPMNRTDRAITDNEQTGFVKVVHKKNGTLLGATIVAGRAGEMITEYALALQHGLKLADLAQVIHVYPTYSMANMQLASEVALNGFLNGTTGRAVRAISKLTR